MIPKTPRIIAILMLVLLASCASHRKMAEQSSVSMSESMAVAEDSVARRVVHTDTTKTTHGKIIVTEIEFDAAPEPETPRADNGARASPVVNINPDGGVSVSNGGNVKSIRQTVIEDETEEKGVGVDESLNESHSEQQAVKNELSQMERSEEKTPAAPQSKRRNIWPWILGAVALTALLYLKRIPVLNFIRKILGALRRIL